MSFLSYFRKNVNKAIALKCIEYYEGNDIFLKLDDNYYHYKDDLLGKKRITYSDLENYIKVTHGSNFSFFKRYNSGLYNLVHSKSINSKDVDYNFCLDRTVLIKPNFQDNEAHKKISKLFSSNKDKDYLIIDLRKSLGGSVKNCANICNILLPKCDIFTQNFKNKIVTYTSDDNYFKFKKIFIFVDKYTASSSEILAYSLKTNLENVVLIGSKTCGKTCGQDIITNKKHHFIFSIVSFSWQIKNFSYKNVEIIKPSDENDFLAAVKQIIK